MAPLRSTTTRLARAFGVLLAAIAIGAGCAPASDPTGELEQHASGAVTAQGTMSAALVTERSTLRALEGRGFGLGAVLFGDRDATTTADLYEHPLYRSYVAAIEGDLASEASTDPTAKVGFVSNHRLFDARFLRSTGAAFDLIGVVNRMDRRAQLPGTCGELRLIYRLAYPESGLPLTLNVIFRQPMRNGACKDVARAWPTTGEPGAPLADALAQGPLAYLANEAATNLSDLVQVETNFQSVRWPGSVTGDMGGLALYVLRVFRFDAATQSFVPKHLENTPDPAAFAGNAANKRRLIDFLKPALAAGGPFTIPAKLDDLLATKSLSVAPRSLTRLGNRPFSQILDAADLAELGATTAGERERLLRKLDTGTCNGCHQVRGIAGFHLLGDDLSFSAKDWLNKLAVGRSPHLLDEEHLRVAEIAAIARGETPPRRAPNAERPAPGRSTLHASCGMPDSSAKIDPSFAEWTCAQGQRCDSLDPNALVGSCEKDRPASIGDACEVGHVVTSSNPRTDAFVLASTGGHRKCTGPDGTGGGTCATSSFNGFPGGACILGCSTIGRTADDGESLCTSIASGSTATACILKGNRLLDCLAENTVPIWGQTCDEKRPCRDDFACARVAGAEPGSGACMPPYFLQQVRNDGHVFAADPCAERHDGRTCVTARDLAVCSKGHSASSTRCAKSCVQGADADACE